MSLILEAIIVSIASISLAVFTKKLRSLMIRLSLLAILAYGLSYTLYWYPVWLGANDPQYSTWAPMVIQSCFGIGLVTGLTTIGIIEWLKKRKENQKSS